MACVPVRTPPRHAKYYRIISICREECTQTPARNRRIGASRVLRFACESGWSLEGSYVRECVWVCAQVNDIPGMGSPKSGEQTTEEEHKKKTAKNKEKYFRPAWYISLMMICIFYILTGYIRMPWSVENDTLSPISLCFSFGGFSYSYFLFFLFFFILGPADAMRAPQQ